MSGLGEPAKARGGTASEVWVLDRRLTCLVCGGGAFGYREVLLNTSGMTFLGMDWANRSAVGAVCTSCGFVHEFLGDKLEWREPEDPGRPWMGTDGR